jgi:hypothetical protein
MESVEYNQNIFADSPSFLCVFLKNGIYHFFIMQGTKKITSL